MAELTNERIIVALAVVTALVARTTSSPATGRRTVENFVTGWYDRRICLTDACTRTAISLLSSVDRSVDPCDNFYKFACGNWHVENPTPSSNYQWTQFSIMAKQMHDKVKVKLKLLLQIAQASIETRGILQSPITWTDIEAVKKAKRSFQTCMDEQTIDEMGLAGIESILRENGGWPLAMLENTWIEGKVPWQKIHKDYTRLGVGALFNIGVFPDVTETGRNMIWVKQPMNFRLPRAQLAVLKDNVKLMHVYTKHIWSVVHSMTDFIKALGFTKPVLSSIKKMIDFEMSLVNITLVHSAEDIDTLNEVVTIDELQQLHDSDDPRSATAKIDWLETIRNVFVDTPEIKINGQEKIRISSEGYIRRLARLLNVTPEETVVNYVHWKMIDKALVHTTRVVRDNVNRFLNETTGLDYSRPREMVCIEETGLDHAIGYAYVKQNFPENAKTTAENLMNQIKKAMAEQIDGSSWLNDETKTLAKEKLSYMSDLIGYPDWYTEKGVNDYYSDLAVGSSYIKNVLSRWKFATQANRRKLRVSVSSARKKWPVSPTTTNAYYNIAANAVIIPAAILRTPFFDAQRPEVVNYGSIGAIIGHEISHGFDDNGRRYDKNGSGNQWWADTVIEQYINRTECFVEQFNKYKIFENANETIYADGRQSLGENIADTIGFQLAYSAYEQWKKNKRNEDFTLPRHEEYTNDQLFFLSLANIWCANDSDEHLKNFAPKDKHSIPSLRVIGALSNMDSFSEAFDCSPGSPMNPTRKCSIWS